MSIEILNSSNERDDYQKYYSRTPDTGFSPEKNAMVVEEVIEKHNNNMKKKKTEFENQIDERSEMVMGWLKHLQKGNNTPIEKYFGKQMMAYMKAEQIRSIHTGDKVLLLSSN